MNILSAQEIMDIIPNRYPIFFIDAVDELIPGEKVVCRKNVTINEEVFQGHFPGEPVFPGVLIVEVTPWWKNLILGLEIGVGVITFACLGLTIASFILKRKEEKENEK